MHIHSEQIGRYTAAEKNVYMFNFRLRECEVCKNVKIGEPVIGIQIK